MRYFSLIILTLIMSCQNTGQQNIDIQGHRGARGNLPENSIPAMLYAIDAGVSTLELDVVVTADSQIVVSHEPWMSSTICLYPDGQPISAEEDMSLNIFKMTLEEVQSFDCGSVIHPQFPEQNPIEVNKPLLSDLLDACEQFVEKDNMKAVNYNIEIKSHPDGDGLYHPTIDVFSELVIKVIDSSIPKYRYNIQSFDVRTLQYIHKTHPDITLSYLIGDMGGKPLSALVDDLGFVPPIISPYYPLVDQTFMDEAVNLGTSVIPWTVNDKDIMKNLVSIGVDGIITDYPMMGIELFGSYQE